MSTVFENIHRHRNCILGQILYEIIYNYQNQQVNDQLGLRYQRSNKKSQITCPRCKGHYFTRKGKRYRFFKSVLGKCLVPLLQIQCCNCHFRFCPFKEQLGLSFGHRISKTLIQRQLDLTCRIPYKQAQ